MSQKNHSQREAGRRLGRPVSRGESSCFWFREAMNEVAWNPSRAFILTFTKRLILLNDFEVARLGMMPIWIMFAAQGAMTIIRPQTTS
ncbi:MAG: hypothetical protein FJ267_03430 [Planctomycetes bacterium]|nr:hypothetical protein [Planctomycetota bacterium]